MNKKPFAVLLFFLFCLSRAYPALLSAQETEAISQLEPIQKSDRILILAPHPDDEAIGCAGIIQQARAQGAQVKVVYLTNGDHNQFAFIVYEKRITLRKGEFIHMGEVRRKEAIKAMQLLGLSEENLVFLGYPDFGTFTIFKDFWQSKKPFKDALTRISRVPYKEDLSFGAPYAPENILADLKSVLKGYRPNKIFISHPADVNVDHKAFYLFLEVALSDLEQELPWPKIYPYLVHCVGWPLPRHYHPELGLLAPKEFAGSSIRWSQYVLTPEELGKKYKAILCYRSQTRSSAFYLLSFARKNELFGSYPELKLALPRAEDTGRRRSLKERLVSFLGLSAMVAEKADSPADDSVSAPDEKRQVSYALSERALLIRVSKSEKIDRRTTAVFYLFGYSHNAPFASMPKVSVITKYNRFKVFAGRKMIEAKGVNLELLPWELILKMPLEILGNPDFILVAVKAYTGKLPFYATGFRRIDIKY